MLRYRLSMCFIKVGIRFIEWGFGIAGDGTVEIHCSPNMDTDHLLVIPLTIGFGMLVILGALALHL